MKFKDYPVAKKMVLLCMLTSITSLVFAGLIIAGYDQYKTKQVLQQEIKVLAKVVANRSHAAILFGDVELAHTNLLSLQARESIQSACIYRVDNDGSTGDNINLFAQYHNQDSAGSCPPTSTLLALMASNYIQFSSRDVDLLQPVSLDNKIIGYLLINSSLLDVTTQMRNHSLLMMLAIGIAAIIALLLATRLEKIISKPLLMLGNTAREITAREDYSIRAVKVSNDEVGVVVDSFNNMLNKIQREDALLRESEEKFRLFSASSSVGIFQTDIEGNCIYANDRFCEITHSTLDIILSQGWLAAIYNKDYERINQAWQHSLRHCENLNINCRFNSDTDEVIWVTGHIGPLTNSQGETIGFLGTISDISDLKNAHLQLEHLAFYDMLTGLANRRLFRDRLEHLLANNTRQQTNIALLFLDIDHFKNTNDTLGHDTGDILLRIIADRLQKCVRASDTVARLGGDEFTVLLVDVKGSVAVSKIAQNILDEICKPIHIGDQIMTVTASIGIVVHSEPGGSAESLIKHADLALYKAKDEGRNNYQFFIEEMNTRLVEQLELIKDVREALENKEFVLHFQPQFRLTDSKIIGFEALVRWISPKRGFVSPMDFIPVAEETGLIIQLGDWILEEACNQMREFITEKVVDQDAVIAVNLSAKQLIQEDLVETIQDILHSSGLTPAQLELEITESMLMENMDKAIDNLHQLKELGISLSIDDFGTGYSSLSYLKTLPVHLVKVDRSFVKDIPDDKDDMEITAAVIAMAHKLNYKVVAEGLETQEQLEFLQECQCDYGQGFMFSRPLPAEEVKVFCLNQKEQQSKYA